MTPRDLIVVGDHTMEHPCAARADARGTVTIPIAVVSLAGTGLWYSD